MYVYIYVCVCVCVCWCVCVVVCVLMCAQCGGEWGWTATDPHTHIQKHNQQHIHNFVKTSSHRILIQIHPSMNNTHSTHSTPPSLLLAPCITGRCPSFCGSCWGSWSENFRAKCNAITIHYIPTPCRASSKCTFNDPAPVFAKVLWDQKRRP